MDNNFIFERVALKEIAIIKPIWEELNSLHRMDSVYFKGHYENFTFEKRASKFFCLDENNIFIEIVKNSEGAAIGYCVSTAEGTSGELDSVCIYPSYRGRGLGEKLVKSSISWLKNKNCKTIRLSVSYGHECVHGFYQKFGFYPRLTYLELKE
jgi:diamine N-acetyltransferase